MASHFFGRGGCRRDGRGCGVHIVDNCPPLPRPPGIHFTHGVINLPNSDRHQGSAPNIVVLFPSINRIFITRIIIFIS
jgi:hypothetical protein